MLQCPREACKRRKAEKAARAAAAAGTQVDSTQPDSLPAESPSAESAPYVSTLSPQLSMRESISSMDDSQDGEIDLSQESTSEQPDLLPLF